MTEFNPQSGIPPTVLATDLDGTFLPLLGNAENLADLEVIKRDIRRAGVKLIYVTGRHLESVNSAVMNFRIPVPDWMICDVGASIYRVDDGSVKEFEPYADHLLGIVNGDGRESIERLLETVRKITLQDPERQHRYKISYECDSGDIGSAMADINRRLEGLSYSVIGSVDPFADCGLIDVLPAGVSKAYAVTWLAQHADFSPDEVVFAGDSGNDKAALVSGFRAIIVANASDDLAAEVRSTLFDRGWPDRFYRATAEATSGVLEGCRHYGLL